jgi:hypothetical protein
MLKKRRRRKNRFYSFRFLERGWDRRMRDREPGYGYLMLYFLLT